MKLEFSRQIFDKYSGIKFNKNPSSGSQDILYRWTDKMTNLILAFCNFANVSKHWVFKCLSEGLPLQVRYKLHCSFENSPLGNIIMMYSSNGNSYNKRKHSGIMYPVSLCVLHQFTMLVYMIRTITRFTACQMLWNTTCRQQRQLQFIASCGYYAGVSV